MTHSPRFSDLVAMLDASCRRFADSPLFGTRGAAGWEWTTYQDFGHFVASCRAYLLDLGVRRGDRVAVISSNRLEWAIVAHATYGLGAAYVPMYESQLDQEWAYILQDSGATVCFVSNQNLLGRLTKVRNQCAQLRHLIAFDNAQDGERSFLALLRNRIGHGAPAVPVAASDVASLIYTSGTTGNPKGVQLTHGNLASNVSALLAITPLTSGERSVGFLPWAHVYGGCLEIHTAIATGGSIAICQDPAQLVAYLREARPTLLFAVPRVWNRIYDDVSKRIAAQPNWVRSLFYGGLHARSKQKRGARLTLGERLVLALATKLLYPKIVAAFGGRLRLAFSGAAALSREVADFIDDLGIEVYEGYGMTESAGAITTNRPGDRRIGSVGKPVPGVQVRLEYVDSGPSDGEEGEIVVYGAGIMAGYHRLDDATRATLTADGGLRTGDLGRFDRDGFLYITGRVKDLFKLSNGKYVAPAALEERLQLSPYIAQCVVHGDNQPHPVALIVVDHDALVDWARERGMASDLGEILHDDRTHDLYFAELAEYEQDFKGYERIGGFILETEPLTIENGLLTPTLKVKRRSVLQKYEARFRSLYAGAEPGRCVSGFFTKDRALQTRERAPRGGVAR